MLQASEDQYRADSFTTANGVTQPSGTLHTKFQEPESELIMVPNKKEKCLTAYGFYIHFSQIKFVHLTYGLYSTIFSWLKVLVTNHGGLQT